MLAVLFVILALAVDGNVLPILTLIPYSVLGVLVIFVGVRHALLVKDVRNARDISVVAVTGVLALVTANLAIGFAAGMVLHLGFKGVRKYCARPATM